MLPTPKTGYYVARAWKPGVGLLRSSMGQWRTRGASAMFAKSLDANWVRAEIPDRTFAQSTAGFVRLPANLKEPRAQKFAPQEGAVDPGEYLLEDVRTLAVALDRCGPERDVLCSMTPLEINR